jgi:hypothetical protein
LLEIYSWTTVCYINVFFPLSVYVLLIICFFVVTVGWMGIVSDLQEEFKCCTEIHVKRFKQRIQY